jgi:two-component system chemotaxis sensor kinase CheA
MKHEELQGKIDQISEGIVLAEPKDGKALNALHALLNEVTNAANAFGMEALADSAKKAGRLIERVVIDSPENSDRLLHQAGTLITTIQSDVRDALSQMSASQAVPSSGEAKEAGGRTPLSMESLESMAEKDELPAVSIVDELLEPPHPAFGEQETLAGGESLPDEKDLIPLPESVDGRGEPDGQAKPALVQESRPEAGSSGASAEGPGKLGIVLPKHVDLDIFTEFLSRQPVVLDEFEAYTLALDTSRDAERINTLKRIVHTLKGEAGLLGLDDVQRLCHTTETLLENDLQHAGLVDILLAVKDWLSRTFASYSGRGKSPGPVDVLMELLFETKWIEPQAAHDDVDIQEEVNAFAAQEEQKPEPVSMAAEIAADDDDDDDEEYESYEESLGGGGDAFFLNMSDVDLLTDFITEASEHLENVENCMLTIETEPDNEATLNTIFRAFHTIKGVAGYLSLEQIGHLSHDVESLLDKARKGDIVLQGRAVDVLFESVDMMKQLVANVKDAMVNSTALVHEPGVNALLNSLRQVLAGKAAAPAKPAQPAKAAAPAKQPAKEIRPVEEQAMKQTESGSSDKVGAPNASSGAAPARRPEAPASPARAQDAEQGGGGDGQFVHVRESIKVDADRLDKLVDTIGELVITESMVSQMMRDKYTDSVMMGNLSQLDKITRQLQEMSTSLRMVPVRTTFQKMARLVRDLAKKSGKSIDFIMTGEDTELDKSVVDKIGDPLVHMIRNSVDHGIESSSERVKNGKSGVGRIELRAFHKGGNIFIEVIDDGQGLSRDRILAKAVENGLVSEGVNLSEKEIYALIFEPGFSTASVVTDISGRGIGMDVVRRNIELLRGRVEIQSTPGKGSIFSIRLPLTLAIIDGMMVGVGDERYIIPTLSIVRSLRPSVEDFSTVQGRGEMYSLDGQMIPVFYLTRLFGVESSNKEGDENLLVVVENDGFFTGLVVDELFGQHQIVIKTLGKLLQGIPGVSGSTIMTDGRVALILDVAGLVKLANRERLGGVVHHPVAGQQGQVQAVPAPPVVEPAAEPVA